MAVSTWQSHRTGAWCTLLFPALLVLLCPATASADGGAPTRIGIGQPVHVGPGEHARDAVAIGADLTVSGDVEENAVVVGGTLRVGPDARIGGDAVAIGGVLMTSEGAVIQGDRVELTGIIGQNVGRNNGSELFGAFASSFASFAQVVGAFLVSALLLAFVPRRLSVVEDQLRTSPGRSALTGLAMLVAFLPLLGALTISIIGIPLIPVAIMVLAVVLVMGMAALALRIGHALPFWGEHRSAMGALALGYLAIGLVALVPWVGAVVVPLASFYAGGAVLASRFGAQARAGHGP